METTLPACAYFLHCTGPQTLRPTEYMLLMPLSGTACLSGAENSPAGTGSILFLAPACSTPVKLQTGTDVLYALIDTAFLERMAGLPRCPPAVVFSEECRQLSGCLADLFELQYAEEQASYLDRHIAACRLLQALTALLSSEAFQPVQPDSGSSRKHQMTAWLEQHFREPVQLRDLAEAFGLSRQHCSAVFHQQTGISFSDCLLQLRLAEAQRLLLTTDKSITVISEESGFPNTGSFHAAFQKVFRMTPKAWRQQNQRSADAPGLSQENLLIAGRLLQERRMLYAKQNSTIHISAVIPADQSVPVNPVWTDILNIDMSRDVLDPTAQWHLAKIQEQMHFRYARLSNLLSSDLIPFFPGVEQYRFTKFLELLDYLKGIGLTPMPAFGNSWLIVPEACVFSDSGYSTDLNSWLQILREMLEVSIRHWGADWVSTWRFEFNMPPVLYGSQEPAVFLELFQASVQMIKSRLPSAQTGGPGMAVNQAALPQWKSWLQAVSAQALPVDFVSLELWADCDMEMHQIAGQYGAILQAYSVKALRSADVSLAKEKLQQLRDMLRQYGLSDRKLYVSAFGVARYQAMAACIGGHCPAYLVKTALELQPLVDGLGCWKALNSEAEYADSWNFLSAGCGLQERHGLQYPAWYAFHFLARLLPRMVWRGETGCVTTDGDGRFVLLLHNCKNYSPAFCRNFRNPQALDFQNPGMYADYSAVEGRMTLTGLQPQTYRITRWLVGDHQGCLAMVIRQTGQISPMTPSIREYLAGQSLPYLHTRTAVSDGSLQLHFTLQPNEVLLILLEPEDGDLWKPSAQDAG